MLKKFSALVFALGACCLTTLAPSSADASCNEFCESECQNGGCVLTVGYWRTHAGTTDCIPNCWPDPFVPTGECATTFCTVLPESCPNFIPVSICVADENTACADPQTWLEILNTPANGNVWILLAQQYIAAQLNIANGASPECLNGPLCEICGVCGENDCLTTGILDTAECLLCEFADNQAGIPFSLAVCLATQLEFFNNGTLDPLCPPHCGSPIPCECCDLCEGFECSSSSSSSSSSSCSHSSLTCGSCPSCPSCSVECGECPECPDCICQVTCPEIPECPECPACPECPDCICEPHCSECTTSSTTSSSTCPEPKAHPVHKLPHNVHKVPAKK